MHCYKMDFPITYITNKDAHNLWIGTINGLYQFNKVNQELKAVNLDSELGCIYSSKDQVSPNQIRMWPPSCMFRPCPADAGWIAATGIFPSFHLRMSPAAFNGTVYAVQCQTVETGTEGNSNDLPYHQQRNIGRRCHAVIRTEGLWAVGYQRCSKGKDWRCERCEQKG